MRPMCGEGQSEQGLARGCLAAPLSGPHRGPLSLRGVARSPRRRRGTVAARNTELLLPSPLATRSPQFLPPRGTQTLPIA